MLSREIKLYNERATSLLSCLKDSIGFINIDMDNKQIDNALTEVYQQTQPFIVHIRGNGSDESHKLKNNVLHELLKEENGFEELEVSDFVHDEMSRNTALGQEFTNLYNNAELITADIIIRMLRKVIYTANGKRNRFVISGFPDTVE